MSFPIPARAATLIVLAALVTGCGAQPQRAGPDPAGVAAARAASPVVPRAAFAAYVERVVDGDTLIAKRAGERAARRVRLIGVDTPETVEPGTPPRCYGHEAAAYTERLLTRRWVHAAYEPGGTRDRFGRDLWDVWLPGGEFVAALLVAGGYARAYPVAPQVRYAGLLARLARAARRAGRGLWGPPCRGDSFG